MEYEYNFILICFFIFGTMFGSFLNLFCYRYPIIYIREYYKSIEEYAILTPEKKQYIKDNEKVGLCLPGSFCPCCKKSIPLYFNVPVIGYFLTRCKCFNCKKTISFQYPLIELITGLLFSLAFYQYGLSINTIFICIAIFLLLSIILIDYKTMLLPNELTVPLLFIGLGINIQSELFTNAWNSFLGASLGYCILYLFVVIYEKIKNKGESMGRGDFCLIAAFGAFFGIKEICILLLISSIIAIIQSIIAKIKNSNPIPFGPALSITFLLYIFMFNYIKLENFL